MLNHHDLRGNAGGELLAVADDLRYLNKLPAGQLLRASMAGTVKQFPRNSDIITEGSHIEEVYIILRGKVSAGLYDGPDTRIRFCVSGPGTIVDTSALLDPPVSLLTVRALSDVEALAVPQQTFVKLMNEETAVGFEVLRNLCNRMSQIKQVTFEQLRSNGPKDRRN